MARESCEERFREFRKGCVHIFDAVIKGDDSAFRITPKNIEQPLKKRRLPFLPPRDDRLALRHVVLQVVIPIAQEVVELLLSPDEEGGIADLFRQGLRDRFRHREHRFHPLCVCLLDYNIRVRAPFNDSQRSVLYDRLGAPDFSRASLSSCFV